MNFRESNSSGIVTKLIPISKSTEFPSTPLVRPFFDPFVQNAEVEEVDEKFREAIIGMTVAWKLLYVVYTIRNAEKFRIISARPATKTERKNYEEY